LVSDKSEEVKGGKLLGLYFHRCGGLLILILERKTYLTLGYRLKLL